MNQRNAIVKQVKGMTFVGKADSSHWVVMDGPERVGGGNGGSSPKELLLLSLGGCTANDVVSILAKKRAPVEGCEIHLTAEVREEHPQVFTSIHIEYVIFGNDVRPQDVERAIELSTTKYCSVSAMLRPSVNLTHSYCIKPPPVQAMNEQSAVGA
jgi:putative redox protein